jgi:hypothetical protein
MPLAMLGAQNPLRIAYAICTRYRRVADHALAPARSERPLVDRGQAQPFGIVEDPLRSDLAWQQRAVQRPTSAFLSPCAQFPHHRKSQKLIQRPPRSKRDTSRATIEAEIGFVSLEAGQTSDSLFASGKRGGPHDQLRADHFFAL